MPETFAPAYHYPYTSQVVPNTIETTLRGGVKKRRDLGAAHREITMSFDGMTDAQADYVDDFYAARLADGASFTFYCSKISANVTVKFDLAQPPELRKVSHNWWMGSCKLIEQL